MEVETVGLSMGMFVILGVIGFFVVAIGLGAILWVFMKDDTRNDD
jgi:hypothetical protein